MPELSSGGSPSTPRGDAALPDGTAVSHVLHRLARAAEPPWLHGEVAHRMAQRLSLVRRQPELLIDWWGWLGAGAAPLAQACPRARRVVFEPVEPMAARSRAAARGRWFDPRRWRGHATEVCTDAAALPAGADLLWANMMLHAVPEPAALFARWLSALRVDGFVMFSCLGPGTLAELRTLYERCGWGAAAQSFIDMHDLGDMLVHAGFADPVMDQETLDLRWDGPQAVLGDLRVLGGNTARDRHAGMRTPRWRERLMRGLASMRGADGRIGLQFEIVYGHAFKAAPRMRAGEATVVGLDDMRRMVGLGRDPR